LKKTCVYWGLEYQVNDDLQDVLASEASMGKPTQRDRMQRRPNLACVIGVPAAQQRLERLVRLAEKSIHDLVQLNRRWSYLNDLHREIFLAAANKSAAA
jgi:geranylgeranyl pyrophosphate synthase